MRTVNAAPAPTPAAALAATWHAAAAAQPAAVDVLRTAAATGRPGHAWVVAGPHGSGQDELAAALAAGLNCVDAVAGEGCGTCRTCQRIGRGTHLAARTFAPEGAEHRVDAVRDEWMPAATRTLPEGRHRVLRVTAAERMNESAQNALLKVLEEPPPNTTWLLEADDPAELLETILSRARRIDLRPWDDAALDAHVDALRARHAALAADARSAPPPLAPLASPGERAAAVALAGGSPARLARLIQEDVWRMRAVACRALTQLRTQGPAHALALAEDVSAWARGRRDALAAAHGAEAHDLGVSVGAVDPDTGKAVRGAAWPPGAKKQMERRHKREASAEVRESLLLWLDCADAWVRDVAAARAGAPTGALLNADLADVAAADADHVPQASLAWLHDLVDETRDAVERNGNDRLLLDRVAYALLISLHHD